MAPVYFYVPASEALSLAECGLKLSKWYGKETEIEGFKKRCICALLSPKDDQDRFEDGFYDCLMLDVPREYSFVAEKHLYDLGQSDQLSMEYYLKSIIPLKDYIFGSYRMPECLITTTVIPGQIKIMNRARDIPVLFNDSLELYLNNLTEAMGEKYRDFKEVSLYYYFNMLANRGKINKITGEETGLGVFVDDEERTYTIKVPD